MFPRGWQNRSLRAMYWNCTTNRPKSQSLTCNTGIITYFLTNYSFFHPVFIRLFTGSFVCLPGQSRPAPRPCSLFKKFISSLPTQKKPALVQESEGSRTDPSDLMLHRIIRITLFSYSQLGRPEEYQLWEIPNFHNKTTFVLSLHFVRIAKYVLLIIFHEY